MPKCSKCRKSKPADKFRMCASCRKKAGDRKGCEGAKIYSHIKRAMRVHIELDNGHVPDGFKSTHEANLVVTMDRIQAEIAERRKRGAPV